MQRLAELPAGSRENLTRLPVERLGGLVTLPISVLEWLGRLCGRDESPNASAMGRFIELIKDQKDQTWKVIELNGRPWLLIDFFRRSGFNFLNMLLYLPAILNKWHQSENRPYFISLFPYLLLLFF